MADPTQAAPSDPQREPLMAAPTAELLPGAIFAGYRIQAKLGQGGMGVVFRAVDTTLERAVALKLMRPELAADQDFAARFLREARTAAQVMHPHVIVIHQAGTHAGSLYMAFEFVAGGDLAGRIRRDGPMPLDAALRMIAQCADGLQAIHEAGMVHRDIKPQNIFLDDHGRAKLGDLGLARHADGDDRMTVTGVGMGTPAFMSPEQAEGAADLDIRSDIHALGATLYMMLTGKAPFTGTTPYAITHQIIAGERPNPRDLRPDLPVAVQDVVLQAMARERHRRYATPAELLAAVEHVLVTIGVGASSGGWAGLAIGSGPGRGDTTRGTGAMGAGATTSVTAGSNLAASPTVTTPPKSGAGDPITAMAPTAILPTHVASGRADHATVANGNTAVMPTGHFQPPGVKRAPDAVAANGSDEVRPGHVRVPWAKEKPPGGKGHWILVAASALALVGLAFIFLPPKPIDNNPPAPTTPPIADSGKQTATQVPSPTPPVSSAATVIAPPSAVPIPAPVAPVPTPPAPTPTAPVVAETPKPAAVVPAPIPVPAIPPTPPVPIVTPPPTPVVPDAAVPTAPVAVVPPKHPKPPRHPPVETPPVSAPTANPMTAPVSVTPPPSPVPMSQSPAAVPTPVPNAPAPVVVAPAPIPPPVPVAPPAPIAVTPAPVAPPAPEPIPTPAPIPDKPQTPAEHLDALLAEEHFQEALKFASRIGDDDAIAAARQRVLERHDQRKNQIQTKVDAAPTLLRARELLQPALETWGLPGDKLWAETALAAKAHALKAP